MLTRRAPRYLLPLVLALVASAAWAHDDDTPLTQIASDTSPAPAIHGPRIVGTTPGRAFLFLIPATGHPPLTYAAEGLPDGLTLDSRTGIISGSVKGAGEYTATITVTGPRGIGSRKLRIVAGDCKLALTPPMGWSSWNAWGDEIDEDKVRHAADSMVKTGLAGHGYQYINIDDSWQSRHRTNGRPRGNWKFRDMKALADYVHGKGLRFGIYSTPGNFTCMGYEGSRGHEDHDAQAYADWGVDYLKYDWCTYGRHAKDHSVPELQRPFKVMRTELDKCGRDIVYSISQRGMGKVWEWGPDVGANLWRTGHDLWDSWGRMSKAGFDMPDECTDCAGPGHWNDPDMLVVGRIGWGYGFHHAELSRDEQITHVTLWSMLAAPLILGCDLSQMDRFTLALLTNDDVIDVDQDPLGKQGRRVARDGVAEIWCRPLWDGTLAVALFNRGPKQVLVAAKWYDLGIRGPQPVRDLWRQIDLGPSDGSFTTAVPSHGAVLLKIGQPNRTDW